MVTFIGSLASAQCLTYWMKIDSFDAPLICDPEATALTKKSGDFVGVFIRAPVCLRLEASFILTVIRLYSGWKKTLHVPKSRY
jgi:hypothetical protein